MHLTFFLFILVCIGYNATTIAQQKNITIEYYVFRKTLQDSINNAFKISNPDNTKLFNKQILQLTPIYLIKVKEGVLLNIKDSFVTTLLLGYIMGKGKKKTLPKRKHIGGTLNSSIKTIKFFVI